MSHQAPEGLSRNQEERNRLPTIDARPWQPAPLFLSVITAIVGGQYLARVVAESPYVRQNPTWLDHIPRAALRIVGEPNPSQEALATVGLLTILIMCVGVVWALLAGVLWMLSERRGRPGYRSRMLPSAASSRSRFSEEDRMLDSEKWRSRVIAEGLAICPSCESDEVTMGACKIGSKTIHQEYTCEVCQHEFTGIFTLAGCYRGHPE
ncbi:hypothetical protein A9762_11625 [Pandoraea sp. ISTKB]|nr:hypothetical protein A9762_11625 [Pandoraea sp. ISTKB]